MVSKAEAMYNKKMKADKAAMSSDYGTSSADQYSEDQGVIDAGNSLLKTGNTFNKVGKNANEEEYRAFLKMTDEEKKKYIQSKGK